MPVTATRHASFQCKRTAFGFATRGRASHYQRMGRDDSRDRSRDWRDTPRTRREPDARAAAERAFKAVTTKPVEAPAKAAPTPLPSAKETVTLRIDRDVLDYFQHDGPGWQDRINAALRKIAGK
jgi:uncharacterized protein (DUF4415 family)